MLFILTVNPGIDPLTSKASLLTKYEKKYFLVHGTGDDNVHFRHSALWEQRLIEAGIRHKTATLVKLFRIIRPGT